MQEEKWDLGPMKRNYFYTTEQTPWEGSSYSREAAIEENMFSNFSFENYFKINY